MTNDWFVMARATGRKATSRKPSVKRPATRPVKTRAVKAVVKAPAPVKAASKAQKPVEVVAPPPVPSVSAAERAQLLTRAWAAKVTALQLKPIAAGAVVILEKGTPAGWLLVTQGLSGKGLELTLRTPRVPEESHAPPWAITLLRWLAELASTQPLSVDQSTLLPTEVLQGLSTEINSVAFAPDAQVGVVQTPHDTLKVLQVVGLTGDEERLVREWSPRGLLEVLAVADKHLTTDLERGSLLFSPRARTAIEQRVMREGSSLQTVTATKSEVGGKDGARVWVLDAATVDTVLALLKGRIAHQRPFTVEGATPVEVVPADEPKFLSNGRAFQLKLTQPAARQVRAQLKPKSGRYEFELLPGFTLEVS